MSVEGEKQRFATRVIHGGQSPDPLTGAVMPPIYATSTYVQSSPGVNKGYDYSRTRNPTRDALQAAVANLEGGTAGFSFASGMATTSTVLELIDSGSHIVSMHHLYGGRYRPFRECPQALGGARCLAGRSDESRSTGSGYPPQHAVGLGRDSNESAAETGRS